MRESPAARLPTAGQKSNARTQPQVLEIILECVAFGHPSLSYKSHIYIKVVEAVYQRSNLWAQGSSVSIDDGKRRDIFINRCILSIFRIIGIVVTVNTVTRCPSP